MAKRPSYKQGEDTEEPKQKLRASVMQNVIYQHFPEALDMNTKN